MSRRWEILALSSDSHQTTQRVADSGHVLGGVGGGSWQEHGHRHRNRYTHLGIVDLVAGLKRLPVMAGKAHRERKVEPMYGDGANGGRSVAVRSKVVAT